MTLPSEPPSAPWRTRVDRVLVVDDDQQFAVELGRYLIRNGFGATLKHDAPSARLAHPHFAGVLELEVSGESGIVLAYDLLAAGCVDHVVFFTGSLDRVTQKAALAVAPLIPKADGAATLLAHLRRLQTR